MEDIRHPTFWILFYLCTTSLVSSQYNLNTFLVKKPTNYCATESPEEPLEKADDMDFDKECKPFEIYSRSPDNMLISFQ